FRPGAAWFHHLALHDALPISARWACTCLLRVLPRVSSSRMPAHCAAVKTLHPCCASSASRNPPPRGATASTGRNGVFTLRGRSQRTASRHAGATLAAARGAPTIAADREGPPRDATLVRRRC